MTQGRAEAPIVTVAGGSIAGLAAGLALAGVGADVHVYERQPGPMSARGAGIVVQPDLLNLLERHDAPALAMTACSARRYLEPGGGDGRLQPAAQRFTSWEAIYCTMRATFPDARYHMGAHVTGHRQADGAVYTSIEDREAVSSDLFVAADGAQSETRQRLLPDVETRYAGYVAWRGTLDERLAPASLVDYFDDMFTFCEARSGGHILCYFIPGDNADASKGRRRLNWVWYVHADKQALDALLTDRHGARHRASLPAGLAPEETVRSVHERARSEVHPRFAELVEATPDPFLQTIADTAVERTVFERVILLGDAAFVVRPHTAAAAAKAAHDATALAQALAAEADIDMGLRRCERQQLTLGRSLVQRGVALGSDWPRAKT